MRARPQVIRALTALAVLGLLASRATAEMIYCPTPIRGLSHATGLSSAGHVAGSIWDTSGWSGHPVAALFDGREVHNLDTLGGRESSATGVNASGQVVGYSLALTNPSRLRAFLHDGSGMHDLGTLGGSYSVAYGINDAGQVVGSASTGDVSTHAFRYASGAMSDLGTLGGRHSEATAISPSGRVAGHSETADGAWHAFLHDGATMHDLGTLGGTNSRATGVNDSGQVVGHSTLPGDTVFHGFLYSKGVMTDLGTLGGKESFALGINAAGDVVGNAQTASRDYHAFLYRDGVMTDLNGLFSPRYGFHFGSAYAINDRGEILVGGVDRNRTAQVFLLTPSGTCPPPPAPEPGGLTLACLGAAGLLAYAWRCRKPR
jgi:probable HAF family extracellular repeat protein